MANTYNTVTVQSSGATLILAANTWRKGVNLYNNGSVVVYIATDSSVATGTGTPILPQGQFTSDGFSPIKGAIYGIAASSTADMRYIEWTA